MAKKQEPITRTEFYFNHYNVTLNNAYNVGLASIVCSGILGLYATIVQDWEIVAVAVVILVPSMGGFISNHEERKYALRMLAEG